MELPQEIWQVISIYLDLSSFHILVQFFPEFTSDPKLSFPLLLERELVSVRDFLEAETVERRSVLLFIVGVYVYNPRMTRRLPMDPFLSRFVRFFQDLPHLVNEEKNVLPHSQDQPRSAGREFAAPRLLRRLLQEYGLEPFGGRKTEF